MAFLAGLTAEQRLVYEAVVTYRQNVFFTGAGGCGKSFLLRHLVTALRSDGERVHVTSSTGVSACNVSGITLHRFVGAGLAQDTVAKCIQYVKSRRFACKQWRSTTVLFIDEVSMLDAGFFEKVDAIAKAIRNDARPFGGLQLVMCGDFCQLPPVQKQTGTDKTTFCFQTEAWKQVIGERVFLLTRGFRQHADADSQTLATVLDELRVGHVSDLAELLLARRCKDPVDTADGIRPTKLSSLRNDVAEENMEELARLEGATKTYESVDRGSDAFVCVLDKDCQAAKVVSLKVGAQVLLLHNLNVPAGMANGSRGVVTSFDEDDDLPIVRLRSGVVARPQPPGDRTG